MILQTSCEQWDQTDNISHISYIPTFEIIDGEYLSYQVNELDTFIDPGAVAYENDKKISLSTLGDTSVKVDEVGLYTIVYYAWNSDELLGIAYRYVSITHNKVSNNDLSGKYTGTIWSPQVNMMVSPINNLGYYKCTEVMGFPGAEMKGEFVDLGRGELVLLPGKGYFGSFGASEGNYTRSTLSWTISLQDPPYEGIDIDVVWSKDDD